MFILFFIIALAVLWAAHGAVYYFFIHFFAIESGGLKAGLAVILFVLSVSFIVSAVLVHWHENPVTRLAYEGAAIWLGAFVNFLIFIGLAVLISATLGFFGFKPNALVLGTIVLAAVACYSVYGIRNAYHPRVKEVSVAMDNLPPVWQERTIIQLSDVHLGAVLGSDYLSRLVDRVNALNPDIILITGDLFDGSAGNLEQFVAPLNRLKASHGIYFVLGNHEVYLGVPKVMDVLAQTQIHVLDNDVADIDGLQIIGASYASYIEGRDIVAAVESRDNFDRGEPSILMFHSPTDISPNGKTNGNSHASMYFSSDTGFSGTKELGADLQLSGHTHAGQLFPFGLVTKLIYRGYDYGLKQSGDLAVYTSSGTGVWGPTMRTSGLCEIVSLKLSSR